MAGTGPASEPFEVWVSSLDHVAHHLTPFSGRSCESPGCDRSRSTVLLATPAKFELPGRVAFCTVFRWCSLTRAAASRDPVTAAITGSLATI